MNKDSLFRSIRVALLLSLIVMVSSACVTAPQGPPRITGPEAVKVDPIKSTSGAIRSINPQCKTFFIKFEDQVDRTTQALPLKVVDLKGPLAQLLLGLGKQEARSIQDADSVIDIIVTELKPGKIGTQYGTDQYRTRLANEGDEIGFFLSEIAAVGYPSTVSIKVDLVLDENPAIKQESKGKSAQKRVSVKADTPESVITKTVLTTKGTYMDRDAKADEAVDAVCSKVVEYIAGMFDTEYVPKQTNTAPNTRKRNSNQ
ncbi:MAG TPA: hypothetical protein VEI57_17540 [Nitrospirota bacterium]|nr:hypothetical protein [Nitrospirota bacterium]